MPFKLRTVSLLLLTCSLFAHSNAMAQVSESYEFVRADWHLAGISEFHANWQDAIGYYEKVIQESMPLPLDVREWYRGTAFWGIARCNSRLGKDQITVRNSLIKAFSHHFWNFALTATDSQLVSNCGRQWLDSLSQFWNGVLNDERPLWQKQAPIVFYPDGYDSSAHWPLIVALHGGNENYVNFAEHWRSIANDVKAVIVIPAGAFRESEITNSWGSDMNVVEKPILDLVADFTSKRLVDASQVYLAGFSQGAQASMELTVICPDIFRGAIAMSGFVDRPISDSILHKAADRGVRIYAMNGEFENLTFQNEIDNFHTNCKKISIPFEQKVLTGTIHEVPLDFHTQFLQAWNWMQPVSHVNRQAGE